MSLEQTTRGRRLAPALLYRLKDTMAGMGVFVGIMAVVSLALIFGILAIVRGAEEGEGSLSFFGSAAMVTMFVIGICIVRSDLRLFIQHGIGRRTTFVVEVVVIVLSSLALAVVGDLMVTAEQAFLGANSPILVSDLYQLLYASETGSQIMALPDHLMSILFFFLAFCCAQLTGMFISMAYYYLNTMWTVVVSIAVPLLLFGGLPVGLVQANVGIDLNIFASPWSAMAFFAASAVVLGALVWLLLRRAPIRPAKA